MGQRSRLTLVFIAACCADTLPPRPLVAPSRPCLRKRGGPTASGGALLAEAKSGVEGPATVGTMLTALQIVNNVAGAGILTLSAGMAVGVGWYPAIVTTTVLGAISGYAFYLIGASCHLTEQRTFKGLWDATLGAATSWVVDLAIWLMCLSAAIIYSGILGDVFTPLLRLAGLPDLLNSRTGNIFAVTAAVLAPLSLLKDLSALSFTSVLGCGAVLYTALFMAVRALDGSYALPAAGRAAGRFVAALPAPLAPAFARTSLWRCDANAFVLVSNLGLAFIAHYNAPAYYAALADASPERFASTCALAFGAITLLYLGCMGFGYATFGDHAASNLLLNYAAADSLAVVGRAATGLSILFGFPLVMVGLRDATCGLLACAADAVHAAHAGGADALRAAAAPEQRRALTLGLLLLVTLIAVSVNDIGVVVGISGALLGAGLVYILPALIYARAARDAAPRWLVPTMLPLGAVIAVLGVYMTLAA